MIGDTIRIPEVKTSKLTVNEGVAEFKVSFNVSGAKRAGVNLNDLVTYLNKASDLTIEPMQADLSLPRKVG